MKSCLILILMSGLMVTQSPAREHELSKDPRALGRQLLQRAQQALGGAEMLAAVRDVTHKMEIALEPPAGGFKMKQVSLFVAPNHIRQEQETPFWSITIYCDGKSGWLSTGRGVQELSADVLRVAKGVLFRQPSTLLLSDLDAARTVKAVSENAVEIANAEGLSVVLEFDVITGLPARQRYNEPVPNGFPRERIETFSDWREVGGIKMPFKAVQQENGVKMLEVTVYEYRINSGNTAEQLSRKP